MVDGRAAEEQLRRLGAAEVQVGGVLPGEPDAAVHLDVLGRREQVRLRAADVRRRRGEGQRLRQVAVAVSLVVSSMRWPQIWCTDR